MELIEKLKGRVDRGEVFCTESISRVVEFKGWKIRSSESTRTRGYSVRVVANGRIGTSATTDSSPAALDEMIDNAIAAAKFGEDLALEFPGKSRFAMPDIYDEKSATIDISALADAGKALMAQIEKYRAECDMNISSAMSSSRVQLTNTEGFSGEFRKSSFALSADLTRVTEGDIYMAWDSYNTTHIPKDMT